MTNAIAYNAIQRHADYMIRTKMDNIPPRYNKPSQWLNLDKIITEVKIIAFEDFHNAAMLIDIFDLLTWQVALGVISRDKLTEFIDALSKNPLFELAVVFIISAEKLA